MSLKQKTNEVFLKHFDTIEHQIDFNPQWRHALTMRGALHHPEHRIKIQCGETQKSTDACRNKIIVIGTQLGPIIIHQRRDSPATTTVVVEVAERLCEANVFQRSSFIPDSEFLNKLFSQNTYPLIEKSAMA